MPPRKPSGDAASSEGTRRSSRIASNPTPTPGSRAKRPSPNKEKSDSGSTKKRAAKEQGGETLSKKKVCTRNVSPSGVCLCLHNIGPRFMPTYLKTHTEDEDQIEGDGPGEGEGSTLSSADIEERQAGD